MHDREAGALMGAEVDVCASRLACCPVLLVATDYDGTLAPLVSRPEQARPQREALVALRALAQLPQTHVAVISGRALNDLAQQLGEVDGVHLVGSHGSEFEPDAADRLSAEQVALLDAALTAAQRVAEQHPGALIEPKPAGLAFHYRQMPEADAQVAVAALLEAAGRAGVYIRHGKKVVELSVVETNKGHALERLRQRVGPSAVLFVGDDATDEDAFRTLSGPDVSVKVGAGATVAEHRLADSQAVTRLLVCLAEQRSAWLAGAAAQPIEEHSLLSDQRTVALVDRQGDLVWLCLPRLDSDAVFASLLGGPTAGRFSIRAIDAPGLPRQSYFDGSMILQSEWNGITLTDYLDCREGRNFQRAGRTDLLRVLKGRGRVRVEFAPRIDFGRVATHLAAAADGLMLLGSASPLVLYAPGVNWALHREGRHDTAVAEIELRDEPVVFELRYGTRSLSPATVDEAQRRTQTQHAWQAWAAALRLPRLYPDLVLRSALTIRALTYGPSGAIAAAATTSLPEHVGGVRNWDYRFCWPRDAALAAGALLELGATGPSLKLLDWLLDRFDQLEPHEMLQPLYAVHGAAPGPEGEIGELCGYRGSRPVRVGNAAAHQVQLDVFGPIADLIGQLAQRGAALSHEHWRLMEAMVDAVAQRWRDPDHGIWEVRLAPRHHVHSKVMCWLTVDRGLTVAAYLGIARDDWHRLRSEIAEEVLARGWSDAYQGFLGAYDEELPDAAALWVGLSGLLPPTDPRVTGTIALVEHSLRVGDSVFRYRADDGLPGLEGGFHLCTAWLIEAYALAGRRDDALQLMEAFVRSAGPTGLLAEEVCAQSGLALGNFPQVYSHLGLIRCAVRLSEAP